MSRVAFEVRSASSGEAYQLVAERTERAVRFTCSCSAGENGMHCKHRVALLLGDASAVVDIEEGALAALHEMAGSSPIMAALELVTEAENAVSLAQRTLKSAKKSLAKAMIG